MLALLRKIIHNARQAGTHWGTDAININIPPSPRAPGGRVTAKNSTSRNRGGVLLRYIIGRQNSPGMGH